MTCHYGLGRSAAGVRGLQSVNIDAKLFVGGTEKLAKMSVDEISEGIPADTTLYIIYQDRSKNPRERPDLEEAEHKLQNAHILYKVIDAAELAIMLYNHGVDISDHI